MRWSVRLALVRGVPIRLHLTFAILLAFLFWRTGTSIGIRAALLELTMVLLLFFCVVLHEFGHALVAIRHGIPITAITLYPFGGVAGLGERITRGAVELRVAVAGPLVNLVLAAVIYALSAGRVLAPGPVLAAQVGATLFWANLLLAGFNLLPAYPLDGGRVLRGALAPRVGWVRATVWSASLGQITGVLLIGVGLFHEPWLVLGGVLILPGANAALRRALALRQLERRRVGDVMLTRLEAVAAEASLADLRGFYEDVPSSDFILHHDDQVVGFLPAARAWSPARTRDLSTNVTAGSVALSVAPPVAPTASVLEALEHLRRSGAEAAPVVDREGHLVGVITRSGLEHTLTLLRVLAEREEAASAG